MNRNREFRPRLERAALLRDPVKPHLCVGLVRESGPGIASVNLTVSRLHDAMVELKREAIARVSVSSQSTDQGQTADWSNNG